MSIPSTSRLSVDDICRLIGRRRLAQLCGVTASAVSNWSADGAFPAKVFLVVSEECRRRGHGCPKSLFKFVHPEWSDVVLLEGVDLT